ncbi:hypothetical protein LENED_010769 [Lentinula edodes]|uniref:Uncharacterized protein n=1 Tax=Lentinula edodes TaxID=5353 RepID=A0A1Q3ENC4_LENED|nr:hypothetical protein LENED_010769 [Lentinula edodes]
MKSTLTETVNVKSIVCHRGCNVLDLILPRWVPTHCHSSWCTTLEALPCRHCGQRHSRIQSQYTIMRGDCVVALDLIG